MLSCQEKSISFNDQVKPLLNEKCISCHGGVKKAGGLSLLYRDAAIAKNEKSGKAAIVPGSAKNSEIYKRINSDDPEYMMPRNGDHLLSKEEVNILEEWINEGAEWDTHWAYEPLTAIDIPSFDHQWAATNIDKYILQKLNEKELRPNDPASKEDLRRRVALDVIGLPAFEMMGDLSYEDMLDELLASPSYGEHWASMWLDLARYADSKGFEKDPHRDIWRYRDWVIDAFNTDMPFDQFTKEQLAGDLIDANDPDKLIATSFHRNSMTNTEGGTDDEEFRVAAVIDRLNTTFEIWQSTPIGCAQCHDHPYDPISQVEFYESMSLFNNTVDADLTADYPFLELYPKGKQAKVDSIIMYISNIEGKRIAENLLLGTKIRQALFPTLIPKDCDDFENTMLYPNGWVSNWGMNVNDMAGRRYYFMYKDIDFEGLDSIKFTYATSGDIATLEARIDSKDGKVLFNTGFEKTKSRSSHEGVGSHEWKTNTVAVGTKMSGAHDLIFEMQNPQVVVPDGILMLKQIDLIYEGTRITEKSIAAKNELLELRRSAERTPIINQKSNKLKRTNQLFIRGNHLNRADTVVENIPSILNDGEYLVKDRLDLAEWLVDKNNPLTARVIVNRIWQRIFGIGIVETLEDLGSMGEAPSNQALLDYLAYQFMHEHNWSMKSLIKEILLSNTYQQSSTIDHEKMKVDPYNQLLARGSRMRLTAEQIRDQALYISELMYDTIGGMSVMPPQPEGVWQTVYNSQKWIEAEGKQKYRRGLYTYWKRSSPYPSMETFDSPSREFCQSRRIKTNTPIQALVTLNDPVYLEAANAMGRLMQLHSSEPLNQIRYAYRKGLGKDPNINTESTLINLYKNAVDELSLADASNSSLDSPAAVVAHAIFNLDGFLNKT